MIVRCVSPRLLDGSAAGPGHLTAGREYLVFGMTLRPGQAATLQVVSDAGVPVHARADQFEVVDARLPAEWEAAVTAGAGGGVMMRPPLFGQPGFLDAYLARDPEALRAFRATLGRLAEEAGVPVPGGLDPGAP